MVINGIFFRTRAACPWRDLPEMYGNWVRILDRLRAGCDGAEGENWTVGVDSTIARAHHHAARVRRIPAAHQQDPMWVLTSCGSDPYQGCQFSVGLWVPVYCGDHSGGSRSVPACALAAV
jgi:hypothetical protein